MYSNKVFNNIKAIIDDGEILEEIDRSFSPYNRKKLSNAITGNGTDVAIVRDYGIAGAIANFPSDEDTTEAIVHVFGRPALLIKDDDFEQPASEVWKQRLEPHRDKLKQAIQSVGRIEVENYAWGDWLGTGWIAEGGLLVTNRHVAREFGAKENGKFVFRKNHQERAIKASIDFKEEFKVDAELEFEITDILFIADNTEPDMAILKLDVDVPGISIDKSIDDQQFVSVIGYPAYDSRNASLPMSRIFSNIYDVKRLMPGMALYKDTDTSFLHDCSTLGGASGSPVMDITTGLAVGLHFGGRYLKQNYAVSGDYVGSKLAEFTGSPNGKR